MNRDELQSAGLGTAMGEANRIKPCKNSHTSLIDRGYKFCPHCGKRLAIVIVCSACTHRFTSNRSFQAHIRMAHRKPNGCPRCGPKARMANERACYSGRKVDGFTVAKDKWHCLDCHMTWTWKNGQAAELKDLSEKLNYVYI